MYFIVKSLIKLHVYRILWILNYNKANFISTKSKIALISVHYYRIYCCLQPGSKSLLRKTSEPDIRFISSKVRTPFKENGVIVSPKKTPHISFYYIILNLELLHCRCSDLDPFRKNPVSGFPSTRALKENPRNRTPFRAINRSGSGSDYKD